MSYTATIETNLGERLRLLHPHGYEGGGAIYAFLAPLEEFCLSSGRKLPEDIQAWLSRLDKYAEQSLCVLAQSLMNSWCLDVGVESLREAEDRWIDAKLIFESTNKIIQALRRANLEATWWYDPESALNDFQVLSQTLALAIERRAEEVRIIFS